MMIACHQPNFMPWPGIFFKAMRAEHLVLLDDVQFPLGGSWVNRNRLKNDQGELWLTVPVWKRGRSLQRIDRVEICNEENWQRKHLFSLEHAYKHSPYWDEHIGFCRQIYQRAWHRLLELNLTILEYLRIALGLDKPFLRNSDFSIDGRGSHRLVALCETLGARKYLAVYSSHKYLDEELFRRHGIEVVYYKYESPIYPQLWGDFRANLSTFDLLFTCGPKSVEIIRQAGWLIESR
ncbi:MAG: WbqC family protein [Deltaproteobacteria bacterium]|nr:MAG: WbqC family protein [Deltaproteobacteria bacterium]